MKKDFQAKKTAALFAFTLIMLFQAASNFGYATSVSFTDNVKYWGDGEAWGTTQGWNKDSVYGSFNGNLNDVVGDPDILGGVATFGVNGNLLKISFDYIVSDKSWSMLAPGNLFINILNGSDDTTWDYVVNTMGDPAKTNATGVNPSLIAGDYDIYNVFVDAKYSATNPYILSGQDLKGTWAGYIIRDNHPIGLAGLANSAHAGTAYFSGFPGEVAGDTTPWAGSAYYSFGDNGLNLNGKNIIIGWEMTCANDVVYSKVDNPVPEPGTFILLGSGLVAAAAFRKKISGCMQ